MDKNEPFSDASYLMSGLKGSRRNISAFAAAISAGAAVGIVVHNCQKSKESG
jgi:hypothetical protein